MAFGTLRGYTWPMEIERCDPEPARRPSARRESSLWPPIAAVFVLTAAFLGLAQGAFEAPESTSAAAVAPIEDSAPVAVPERDAETLLAVERDTLIETPFDGSGPMIAGSERSLGDTLAQRDEIPASAPAQPPIPQFSATPDAQAAVTAVQNVAAAQAAQDQKQRQAKAYGSQRRVFGKYDVFTGQRTSSRRVER